jgi:hypothetical protein
MGYRAMKYVRLAILALAFMCSPALAQWQVPDHAVPIGRGGGNMGFRSAAPGNADYPFLSNGAAADPSFRRLPNAGLVPASSNTLKGSLDGTTSDIAIMSCSALYQFTQWVSGTGWQCGLTPVLPSRAIAATLNLSAFSAVKTLGYALPGDGGGAYFAKRTAASFVDAFPAACVVVGGSGYVNGTYRGVQLTGGTGNGVTAVITVAGTAVTVVDYAASPGWAYSAGDVLTTANTNLGGTGSGFTCTVAAVSTPTGSFSDTAANRWQLTRDAADNNNVLQFGVKNDWRNATGDAGATNNFTTMQNAWFYAGYSGQTGGTIDGGGSAGSRIKLPTGTMLVCGGASSLILPPNVAVEGANIWSSTIKMCDTGQNDNTHFITICNPETRLACFASELRNLTLYASFAHTSDANRAMVYSNNIQQVDFLDRVAIYAGRRNCVKLESGYGGAALLGIQNLECVPGSGGVNAGIAINFGTTLVTMQNVHVETGGGGLAINGLEIVGGFVDVVGFHSEGIVSPIFVNISGTNSNGMVRLHNLSGGAGCTSMVTKQGGSAANSLIVGTTVLNGCTNSVNNGGVLTAANIAGDVVF